MKRTIAAAAIASLTAACAHTGAPLDEIARLIEAESLAGPSGETIVKCAANGMLASLDPYSFYLDPAEYADFKTDLAGAFTGVGVVIGPPGPDRPGLHRVVSPLDGGPARAAGVLPGDLIAAVDDAPAEDLSLDEIVDRLRGPRGTVVRLRVLRPPDLVAVDFAISRNVVEVEVVSARRIGEVAVMRISEFNEFTARQFDREMREVKAAGAVRGVALDLRMNSGGLMKAATEIADAFLDGGVIVEERGRGKPQPVYATPGDIAEGAPVMVLVDRTTASSAEVLAGALQDRGRAKLVGEPTFGKGSIQTVHPLSNGGGARLTIGRFHFASGAGVSETGLPPDIETAVAPPTDAPQDPLLPKLEALEACDFAGAQWERRSAAREANAPAARCPAGEDCQLARAIAEIESMRR